LQLYGGFIAQINAIPLRILGSLNHGWNMLPLTGQPWGHSIFCSAKVSYKGAGIAGILSLG